MFKFVFVKIILKLYIRHRSIYKAQTTRSVRDCFYPMSPLEKKGWVGNWKMNFHLERSLTEVIDSSLRTCLTLNEARKARKVDKTPSETKKANKAKNKPSKA